MEAVALSLFSSFFGKNDAIIAIFLAENLVFSILILTFVADICKYLNLFEVTEPIVFGSAFVSIYGKAFITLCFGFLKSGSFILDLKTK